MAHAGSIFRPPRSRGRHRIPRTHGDCTEMRLVCSAVPRRRIDLECGDEARGKISLMRNLPRRRVTALKPRNTPDAGSTRDGCRAFGAILKRRFDAGRMWVPEFNPQFAIRNGPAPHPRGAHFHFLRLTIFAGAMPYVSISSMFCSLNFTLAAQMIMPSPLSSASSFISTTPMV